MLLAAVDAFIGYGIAMALARALFAPYFGQLRLVPVGDAAAAAAIVWTRRIVAVSIGGYAIAEAGLLLGLSHAAHEGLLKLVGFVVSLLVAIIVLSNRAPLRRLIEPHGESRGPFAVARRRFAAIWHFLVAFYVMALWLVWALDVPDGFERLVRFFLLTTAVLATGRVLGVLLIRAFDNWSGGRRNGTSRPVGLDARLDRYHPLIRGALNSLVLATTIVLLLEVWGLHSLSWFAGDGVGGRLVSALLTLGVDGRGRAGRVGGPQRVYRAAPRAAGEGKPSSPAPPGCARCCRASAPRC